VAINPSYILYHDNEKIVIRNYEGKIRIVLAHLSVATARSLPFAL